MARTKQTVRIVRPQPYPQRNSSTTLTATVTQVIVPLDKLQRITCVIPALDEGIYETWSTFINHPLNAEQIEQLRKFVVRMESRDPVLMHEHQAFKQAFWDGTVYSKPAHTFIYSRFTYNGHQLTNTPGHAKIILQI